MDEKQTLRNSHSDLSLQSQDWNPEEFTSGSNAKKEWRCPVGHILSPALAGGLGKINQTLVLFVQVQKYWQALMISSPPILRSLNKQMAGIQVLFLQEVESDWNGSAPKGRGSKLTFRMFLP